MAGFCDSGPGLQTPKFGKCEANSSKVSGHYREYSRFRETGAGDQVRSALRGVAGVEFRVILQCRAARLGSFRPRIAWRIWQSDQAAGIRRRRYNRGCTL
jgi:hypothetical protein